MAGMERTAEDIAQEAVRDEVFMKGSGGGVTFSGGEPLAQIDLCVEIAKILQISASAVKMRLKRGREFLKEELEKE